MVKKRSRRTSIHSSSDNDFEILEEKTIESPRRRRKLKRIYDFSSNSEPIGKQQASTFKVLRNNKAMSSGFNLKAGNGKSTPKSSNSQEKEEQEKIQTEPVADPEALMPHIENSSQPAHISTPVEPTVTPSTLTTTLESLRHNLDLTISTHTNKFMADLLLIFQNLVHEKDSQIEELTSHIHSKEDETQQLHSTLEQLQNKLKESESTILQMETNHQDKLNAVELKRKENSQDYDKLKSQLEESIDQNSTLSAKNSKLQEMVQRRQTELNRLRSKLKDSQNIKEKSDSKEKLLNNNKQGNTPTASPSSLSLSKPSTRTDKDHDPILFRPNVINSINKQKLKIKPRGECPSLIRIPKSKYSINDKLTRAPKIKKVSNNAEKKKHVPF
ncbi:hypothetical protein WICPIJ_007325 [Wickerhamomyces pijperi]|uniref:Uncharacterized protein n=1 Tax=Wickerhamomyces pijperi TaxID=599730 RepID=A0A9P8TJD7_WICPI|nr:hypothetical protein WICPIJ_007325 [Wickerhamomyces pijperi]